MPTKEDRVKINARIPKSLYDWIGSEYGNVSQAVNDGLQLLMEKSKTGDSNTGNCDTNCDTGCDTLAHKSPQEPTNQIEELSHELKARSEELERQIKYLEENLKKAPDYGEFSRLQTRSEELEKHNQTLNGELEKAHRDKETIQSLYDNYMRQMQTLIQQKAIEAPGNKKPWWKFW